MSEAKRAYEQGGVDALRRILEEYESSPESVQGTGVAADLVHVIRQIRRLQKRLVQIELEVVSLIDSDIAKLRPKRTRPELRDTSPFIPLYTQYRTY